MKKVFCKTHEWLTIQVPPICHLNSIFTSVYTDVWRFRVRNYVKLYFPTQNRRLAHFSNWTSELKAADSKHRCIWSHRIFNNKFCILRKEKTRVFVTKLILRIENKKENKAWRYLQLKYYCCFFFQITFQKR